jgi:cell division protein FtsQ
VKRSQPNPLEDASPVPAKAASIPPSRASGQSRHSRASSKHSQGDGPLQDLLANASATSRKAKKSSNTSNTDQPDDWKRKNVAAKPARAWLGTLFALVAILGLGAGVFFALRDYTRTSARFALSEIKVSGMKRKTQDDIIALSGLKKGDNIFQIDLNRAREKMLEDAWISDVSAVRVLPNQVVVQVTERKAAALVILGETYLATREGYVFKRLMAGDDLDLPVISGLSLADLEADRAGTEASIKQALNLASDYQSFELAARYPLQQIVSHKDGQMDLVIGKAALTLALGRPPFRRKIEQAGRVLRDAEKRGSQLTTLLFDNDGKQARVVARFR